MNTMRLKHTNRKNSAPFLIWGLAATFGLFFASPGPTSAQELFALSTKSGLELYQVEKLNRSELLVNTYYSAIRPALGGGNFAPKPTLSAYGITGNSHLIHSGIQTTLNGRILTMAGRIDWQPSSDRNHLSNDLVASLTGANPR